MDMKNYKIFNIKIVFTLILLLAASLSLISCTDNDKLGPEEPVPGQPVGPEHPQQPDDPDPGVNAAYIDNGMVRLGVDLDRGGSIFHFSEAATKRNLLNHYDEGRFIQQSYYGEADGSNWSGQPWSWNPIQGGGSNGTKARILSQQIDATSIRIVTEPVHWASGAALPECEMEETITLDGPVAHIHFTFRNDGPGAKDHPATSQELPAVFVDADLPNLVYYNGASPWTGGPLQSDVPGWPNEERTRTEHWAAYVDAAGWGIGVYTPGTPLSTTYRFGGPGGAMGSGCSYFAPVRSFAVTQGLVFEYDVYLYIGTVGEIRSAFDAIRMNGWELGDPDYPKGYFYIAGQEDLTVERLSVSGATGNAYRLTVSGPDPSFTTQRIPVGISGCVLSFQYKSAVDIPLSVNMDIENQNVATRIMPLEAASDWKTYSFDLGMETERIGWGSKGSRFRLLFGADAGTAVEIKDLCVRARNEEERALASSLFIRLQGPGNQLDRFEDLTDYFNYQTG